MLSNVFTALALFAVGAAAQSSSAVPSGVPGLDACILTCLTQATASGGCSSFTDLQCVCTSTAFQSAAQQCLTSQCTQADQQAALQLQQSQCASISSAASSVSSTESAATSTLTSAQSSLSSSVSSVLSSLSSKAASETSAASSALSSIKSSLSSVVSSATSAAATSNSAGARVAFDSMGGVLTLGFAVLGAIAGGAMVI